MSVYVCVCVLAFNKYQVLASILLVKWDHFPGCNDFKGGFERRGFKVEVRTGFS